MSSTRSPKAPTWWPPSQGLTVGELDSLPPRWEGFLVAQRQLCAERHAQRGAPHWLLRDLDATLDAWMPSIASDSRRVILTGEYTPFNLLVEERAGGCRLTGMFDFGDSMIGIPEYDLLGPVLFSCRGDAALVRAFLWGYHGNGFRLTLEFRMRQMCLALLHRYADFDRQIRIRGWQTRASSLEHLSRILWPAFDR